MLKNAQDTCDPSTDLSQAFRSAAVEAISTEAILDWRLNWVWVKMGNSFSRLWEHCDELWGFRGVSLIFWQINLWLQAGKNARVGRPQCKSSSRGLLARVSTAFRMMSLILCILGLDIDWLEHTQWNCVHATVNPCRKNAFSTSVAAQISAFQHCL